MVAGQRRRCDPAEARRFSGYHAVGGSVVRRSSPGRSSAAHKAAKSFRLNGTTNEDGQRTTLDVKISGSNVAGTPGLGNTTVQVLRVAPRST